MGVRIEKKESERTNFGHGGYSLNAISEGSSKPYFLYN